MRWKLLLAVGFTIFCSEPFSRMNVAGADVRAAIVMPCQVVCPSGTIAIAIGAFPDICIEGSDVCLTVAVFPEPPISPDAIDIPPVLVIFIVVAVAAALVSELRSLPRTTAPAIPIAVRATRTKLWNDTRLLIKGLVIVPPVTRC